jgi:apolipoprotein N-acyltransferase
LLVASAAALAIPFEQPAASNQQPSMPFRILLAIISGFLFAFSFPNVAIGWFAFVAFIPLFLALAGATSAWQAAFLGWIQQTTAWLLMVPWVVRVMSHYGGLPYITGVLIFVAMCAVLGLYGALFGWIVWRIAPGASFARWLLIALAWPAVEYVRTYALTGFPWNFLAAAIVDYTSMIQIDRVAGPYLVGGLILIPALVMAWLITQRPRGIEPVLVIGGACVLLFVWWATGLVASKLFERPRGGATYRAALLQPNISQEMRWNEENLVAIYQRMMRMTDAGVAAGARIVIWPESTVPLSYSSSDFYRDSIESISRQHHCDIILGSVAEDPRAADRMWNAAFLVSDGKTIGHYDKIRLVPFGEYVPLRKMLFFAKKLVRAVGEFEFGTRDTPLGGELRYGPAICYEVVFPEITRTQVRNGANVLVTITNDAWYDGTSAPRQHLNQARLRAVEDDRWLLRAATTGISAWIDPTGRVMREIPMGHEGILLAKYAVKKTVTPYVRFGDWFAYLSVAVVIIALVIRRRIEGRGSR